MGGIDEAYAAVQRFLATAKQPAAIEPGAELLLIEKDCCDVQLSGSRLMLHVWTSERNLVRRITGIASDAPAKLGLTFERFGKQAGSIELVDLARPSNQAVPRRAAREIYRERFRRSLLRQFPGAAIVSLSSDPDLQHSFSPAYSRALVRYRGVGWAAMGVPPEQRDVDGVLSFGLIWLDYLRKRERRIAVQGLALFLPEGKQRETCLRLLHLSAADVQWSVFIYGDGFEEPVDLRDYGNIETVLPVQRSGAFAPDWMLPVASESGVETVSQPDGGVSWRVNGLTFASFSGSQVSFGVETVTTASASNVPEIVGLCRELMRRRSPEAVDRRSSLFLRNPESWLESRVRSRIVDLDATLLPAPVYGQVPAVAAGQRGVIDLLACDHAGRLAVVEVKVSEDLHLPLQALDYWIRVKWHLDLDEFTARGFFPGIALQKQSPRMLLVAPSLNFHPATESILRYFPADMKIERIGVSREWRSDLTVAFRAEGHSSPAAQMWVADQV
jgi:hypothetical protein